MKKLLVIILAVLLIVPMHVSAGKKKNNKETMQWRYEVQDISATGKQGTAVFKIWTYTKKEKDALNQAGKNAVHALIFKGFGVQPALVAGEEIYEQNKEWFDEFFKDGGNYQLYVQFSNNGAIAPGDKIELETKEWKVGIKVIVRKDALRECLEKAGIIQKANAIF